MREGRTSGCTSCSARTPCRESGFATTLASFSDMNAEGVKVDRVVADGAAPVRRFEPGHPDADADGYVSYPAINPVEEMVNLMGAARAYQLNASAVAEHEEHDSSVDRHYQVVATAAEER